LLYAQVAGQSGATGRGFGDYQRFVRTGMALNEAAQATKSELLDRYREALIVLFYLNQSVHDVDSSKNFRN